MRGELMRYHKLLGVASLVAIAAVAAAEPEFLDTFKSHFKIQDSSAIGKKSCGICHVSDEDYGFNPFGRDVKKEMFAVSAKDLTTAILDKVVTEDSVGDGVTNALRISAGIAPGEGKPKAENAPPPKEEPKSPIPKNGFHPAIVHFPIALFLGALLLDFIGLVRKNDSFLLAGWYNLVLAAISSLGGLGSGYLAMTLSHFPMRGTIKTHLLLAIGSTVAMWIMVALRVHKHDKMVPFARAIYYILALGAMIAISVAGHLGGVVVYHE